jgi:hypothetical protein
LFTDESSSQPYAGLLFETESPIAANDRLAFTARADRPMRISVQLRTAMHGAGPEERWQRSVYLDATDRVQTVYFDDMMPVGPTRTARPALTDIRDVMFMVDTTNTKPGSAGEVRIKRAVLQR